MMNAERIPQVEKRNPEDGAIIGSLIISRIIREDMEFRRINDCISRGDFATAIPLLERLARIEPGSVTKAEDAGDYVSMEGDVVFLDGNDELVAPARFILADVYMKMGVPRPYRWEECV